LIVNRSGRALTRPDSELFGSGKAALRASLSLRPWVAAERLVRLLAAAGGAICGHEELAVRALEAAVALCLAGDQFGRERLLAVWAHDLV
jgi:hypothetical protein